MRPKNGLFEPIAVGGIPLGNRIAVSPMCQYSAEGGSANDWHLQHLGSLALSGAGLVMVEIGFDYVCVSSGGISPQARVDPAPGYQVPFAATVKKASGIAVQAVGMIVDPNQAEAIVAGGHADWIALARAFLDDPRWVWHAADVLGADIAYPPQYRRAHPDQWPGAALARPRNLSRRLKS